MYTLNWVSTIRGEVHLIELFTLMRVRHPDTKLFRIYLDNARYHHAVVLKAWIAQVRQEQGVVFDLKHLPAYSPNLNLIERLWKFLRKRLFHKPHVVCFRRFRL